MKKCRYCGESKPKTKEYFHRHSETGDGFANRCKSCTAKYQKSLRKDPNKRRKQQAANRRYVRAKRRAEKEKREGKIDRFVALLKSDGYELIEHRRSKKGTTTLVRVLDDLGQVRTFYFSWRANRVYRKETDGQSKKEKELQKRAAAKEIPEA